MFRYLVFYLIFASTIFTQSLNSNFGRPFVQNFLPQDYNAGAQNWAAVQDNRGILYFANHNGILEYDGIKWRLISILDNRTAFSINIDNNNQIWCGSLNDFGFLAVDSTGSFYYESLGYLIPDSLNPIGKVRSIKTIDNSTYILTPKVLFRITDGKLNYWLPISKFYRQYVINKNLYVYEITKGLKTLQNDSLVYPNIGIIYPEDPVMAFFEYDDGKKFFATWKNGLFTSSNNEVIKFKTPINEEIKDNPVINAQLFGNDKVVIAGFTGGSYLVDTTGKLIWKLNKSIGLENELCNQIFTDNSGALWLCNNNGLSRIEVNSPFRFFGENEGIKENITFITKYDSSLYVATEDKLYLLSDNSLKFKKIDEIELCYTLMPVGDQLLAAAHYGVYEIKNAKRKNLIVLDNKSCYSLCRSNIDSNLIYVGTDSDLSTLRFINGRWKYEGKVEGVNGEIQDITELPSGDLWLCTLGQGIIKYSLSKDNNRIEHFGIEDGLYDLKNYKMTSVNDELLFYSPFSPVLTYDESKKKFFPETINFNKKENISLLVEDHNSDVWLKKVSKNNSGVSFGRRNNNSSFTFTDNVFNRLNGNNIGFIYPENDDVTWFGTASGIIRYNSKEEFEIPEIHNAIIRRVGYRDSTVFGGIYYSNIKSRFPHDNNYVRFEFALPSFENKKAVQFQYYLKGYEDEWSAWTNETQKDYTNLFEGEYTFHVRAKDIYGRISGEDNFTFVIKPPWYRTYFAYITYFGIFLISIFFVDKFRTNQINKKNKIELEKKLKHQQEIEKVKSEERQKVRKKTAADFHDDLGHLLTKISLFTEMARKNSGENKSVQKYLSGIVSNTSQLSSSMKDLIWTLDSEKDTFYDALIRIKDFGESLFEQSSITFLTKGIPEELMNIKLNMEKRRHLVLIFKEIMNNSCKYSKADTAELSVKYVDGEINITFKDDGIGFDKSNIYSGNGLKNVRMRSDSINTDLLIESIPGKTLFSLSFKNVFENSSNG
ncbi:MAG: hypothetical protein KDC88_08040 [Ignavibacteriae bacterium]|nr:hypothetical protein [Ignavibacteriota bacterium]